MRLGVEMISGGFRNLVVALLALLAVANNAVHAQSQRAATADAEGANLPAQRIGANDLITVAVYDSPELSRTVRVSDDGRIRLPMLKRYVSAEGLMPGELERVIADELVSEQLIVDPFVTVTVAEYSSRPISVAGAVRTPLTFQAVRPTTLLEAITKAGGLSPDAGQEILLTRKQPAADSAPTALVQRISVKALIDEADPAVNLKLTGGEEIRVPEAGKIFVVGSVKKPGAYPLQDTSETTILKVLALAEGLAPLAGNQAFIYRRESGAGSKNEIPVELKKIMDRKSPDALLMANDILYVPDARGRRLGMAALEKILMFGTTAGATALVYGTIR
jgi:polysaccharide biosynthesis/export protein